MAAPENTKTTAPVPAPLSNEAMMNLMGATQSPAMQIFLNDALFNRCKDVARIIAHAEGVTPAHLIGKPEACFSVVSMSLIWKLAPTMVAGSTFVVGNKLGYEGKLIQAILENSGKIVGTPKPEYFGDWTKVQGKFTKKRNDKGKEYAVQAWTDADEEGLGVIVRAQVIGEAEPREFSFLLKQAFPRNSTIWATDPKTQLWYTAVRRFASVAAPGILMGVPFDRDEVMAMGEMIDVTPDDAQPSRPKRPSRAQAKAAEREMDEQFKSTVGAPTAGETIIGDDDEPNTAGDNHVNTGEEPQPGSEETGDPADDFAADDLASPDVDDGPQEGGEPEQEDAPEETAPPAKVEPAKKTAPKPQEAKPAPAATKAPPAEEAPAAAAETVSEAKAKEIQKQAETGFLNAMSIARLDEIKEAMMPQITKLKGSHEERYKKIVDAYKARAAYLKSRNDQ